jgi:hypothetical protein
MRDTVLTQKRIYGSLRNSFSEPKTSRQPLGSIKNYEHFTSERQLINRSEERNTHSAKRKAGKACGPSPFFFDSLPRRVEDSPEEVGDDRRLEVDG